MTEFIDESDIIKHGSIVHRMLMDREMSTGHIRLCLFIYKSTEIKQGVILSNSTLAKIMNLTTRCITRQILTLAKKGYISIQYSGYGIRKLYTDGRKSKGKPSCPKNNKNSISGVYLIGKEGSVKIGVSKNVKSRYKALLTGSDNLDIQIIDFKLVKNAYSVEKKLHKHFDFKRLNGEWFNLNKEDIEKAKSILESAQILME